MKSTNVEDTVEEGTGRSSRRNRSVDDPNNVLKFYQIKQTIGEGAFSKVKLALHLPDKKTVAIKFLDKNKLRNKNDAIRVAREIKILNILNNFISSEKESNVIKLFEIIESPDFYYIVMEYVGGGELFTQIVTKKRFDEKECSFFFYQIINALDFLHSNKIVHRDLKPENILLGEKKIIKLIDFGLSRNFASTSTMTTPCGSPFYAAPELVERKTYSGPKIDIWSAGVVLYVMSCGFLPFEDKDMQALFKKITKAEVNYPPFITNNIKDLLEKILVKDPKDRITISEIKLHPLFQLGKSEYAKRIGDNKKNYNSEKLEVLDNPSKSSYKENKLSNKSISVNCQEHTKIINKNQHTNSFTLQNRPKTTKSIYNKTNTFFALDNQIICLNSVDLKNGIERNKYESKNKIVSRNRGIPPTNKKTIITKTKNTIKSNETYDLDFINLDERKLSKEKKKVNLKISILENDEENKMTEETINAIKILNKTKNKNSNSENLSKQKSLIISKLNFNLLNPLARNEKRNSPTKKKTYINEVKLNSLVTSLHKKKDSANIIIKDSPLAEENLKENQPISVRTTANSGLGSPICNTVHKLNKKHIKLKSYDIDYSPKKVSQNIFMANTTKNFYHKNRNEMKSTFIANDIILSKKRENKLSQVFSNLIINNKEKKTSSNGKTHKKITNEKMVLHKLIDLVKVK